jgi:hypothetical protein
MSGKKTAIVTGIVRVIEKRAEQGNGVRKLEPWTPRTFSQGLCTRTLGSQSRFVRPLPITNLVVTIEDEMHNAVHYSRKGKFRQH